MLLLLLLLQEIVNTVELSDIDLPYLITVLLLLLQEIVNTVEVSDIDLPYVMHMLSSEEIEGLPPGGGLSAKRAVIETKLNQLLPSLRDSEAGEDREYLL